MAKQLDKKFIGNDQIDGTKLKLLVGQTIRKDDGVGGSVDVLAEIDSSIAVVQSDLANEVSNRLVVEADFESRITDSESNIVTQFASISTLQTELDAAELAIANEIMRATGVEGGIDSRLVTAEGEINVLQSDVDAVELALANEIMRATGIEGGIDSRLVTAEGEINVLQSDLDANELALANEIMRATGIEGGIDSRLVTAEGEINVLQSDVDAAELSIANEIMRATGVEGSLQTQITALTGGTSGSIATVQAALTQEIADREAADAVLQTQIDNVLSNVDGSALDSLTEIVTAFQSADSTLNGAITALSTGLSADIAAEEAARIAADADIMSEVSTNSTIANDRWTISQAADVALDGRLDVLEAVVWFKEKFSIVNGQTSVTLSHVPKAGSMSAFVDRLAIHEGATEDYGIVGTAMTFFNDLVSPGQSQLGNGDTVYVKYQK